MTRRTATRAAGARPLRTALEALVEALVHPCEATVSGRWRLLPAVLGLAFAARAAVALAGDFVLHPDEIMQYLEPAHRLVFGNGVIYWEWFYGARSWLLPGAVAAVLALFDLLGLGQPAWYVGGVKLFFCALSLAVPAAMYGFARRHFGETAARVALVAGAFWYELAGFAHKPLTELVALAPVVALLALCLRAEIGRPRAVAAAGLAVLAGAIRMHYAPVVLVLLAIVFVRTRHKLLLAGVAAAVFGAVGVFDALTWDGVLFHSYLTNLRFNLVGGSEFGEEPAWLLPWWLLLAGGGLSVLCLLAALRSPRRYGLLLGLIALVLATHAVPAHKEYRFVFVVAPLWLLIGSDLAARAAAWSAARWPRHAAVPRWTLGVAGVLFAAVSCAGVLKALPGQVLVYRDWSDEAALFGFVRRQDPLFAAYRYLARAPGVGGVWQVDRGYSSAPGYYYLHRAVPLYDAFVGRAAARNLVTLSAHVSHLVTGNPELTVRGYSPEWEFGGVRILRRDATQPPVRRWREYAPVIVQGFVLEAMRQLDADTPAGPADAGIQFDDREQPEEYRLELAATALLDQGHFADALATYREALAANPDYAPAHAGAGRALYHLERHEEALQALGRAVALQPDWVLAAGVRRLMGRVEQELGRPDAAAGHFEHVLQIEPRDTVALDRLAMIRFAQGRYGDALGLYRRLTEVNPDSALTHANLGATLYYLNRPDEAIESYEHALALDPSLESARDAIEHVRAHPRPPAP